MSNLTVAVVDDLELLLCRVKQHTEADLALKLRKNTHTEKKEIATRRRLDEVVKTLVRKGYNPNRYGENVENPELF